MDEMQDHIEVTVLITWAPFHFQAWQHVTSDASKGSICFTDPDSDIECVIGRVAYFTQADTGKKQWETWPEATPLDQVEPAPDMVFGDMKSAALRLLNDYYGPPV